ncbi:MAG: phosphatidylglycerophosphatase A family protein [bacterium]
MNELNHQNQAPAPSLDELLKSPVLLLAFGFGSGLSPKAPGTAGTIVAIPLYLLMTNLMPAAYLVVVLIGFLAGVWICGNASARLGVHDHGGIVWDEIVGFWITMVAIPCTWYWVLLGFVLFRLFDIWKPWPISLADKRVHGGLGIMLDDVLAGAISWIILFTIVTVTG